MKKILLLLILFFNANVFCQKNDKKYTKAKLEIWNENDPFAKLVQVPEKWKNESAVYLCRQDIFDYAMAFSLVIERHKIRRRIKLQDLAAVKEYSDFTLNQKMDKSKDGVFGDDVMGIKIIKPDGREIELNVTENAKIVNEKTILAIPGLEVNDIIDYFYYNVEQINAQSKNLNADSDILAAKYPTLNLSLDFVFPDNNYYLNFNSFNNAPKLQKIENKEDSNKRTYRFEAKDIEKMEELSWFYPLLEMPSYRFKIAYASNNKDQANLPLMADSSEIIKEKISKEEIGNYLEKMYKPFGNLAAVEKAIERNTFANEEEKVTYAYYFIRYYFLTRGFEEYNALQSNPKNFNPYFYSKIAFMEKDTYFNYFMAFLKESKISYDFVVATKKQNRALEESYNDFEIFIRVNTPNPIFINYYSPFGDLNQFDSDLEGTEAYIIKHKNGKRILDTETLILPLSKSDDNYSKTVTSIQLENFENLKVSRKVNVKGNLKYDEQSEKLYYFDYVQEDKDRYRLKEDANEDEKLQKNKSKYNDYQANLKKYHEKQTETLKERITKEFDVKEVFDYDFKVKNTGRFGKSSFFTFTENITFKNDFIKKAGDNFILEIGKFLTAQKEITVKEKTRKYDIYMPFPRVFENTIQFEIPTGYKIVGLEKLNKKVQNETGQFTSTATLKENKLIINTRKEYSHAYEPNKNWDKMVEFLESAFQFTQEKVILKKRIICEFISFIEAWI